MGKEELLPAADVSVYCCSHYGDKCKGNTLKMERLHFGECFSSYSEDFSCNCFGLFLGLLSVLCEAFLEAVCLGIHLEIFPVFFSSSFHILGLGLKVFVNPF